MLIGLFFGMLMGLFWHAYGALSVCLQGSFDKLTGLFWNAYRALLACLQGSFGKLIGLFWHAYLAAHGLDRVGQ